MQPSPPLLVRGVYYDQFQPEQLPGECNTFDEFCAEVGEWLQDNRPVDPELAVKSVFRVLARHVSPGEIANVMQALPKEIRQAWPEGERGGGGQDQGFIGRQPSTGEATQRTPESATEGSKRS